MDQTARGIKRLCLFCGALFFDLNKNPIICPSCGKEHIKEDALKLRRMEEATPEADEQNDDLDNFEEVHLNDDDKVLEDTSDLGDNDVMVEPNKNSDDKEE